MWGSHPEPASGCDPLTSSFHWRVQSRARRMERPNPCYTAQTGTAINDYVP
jgi:hypothetical protein